MIIARILTDELGEFNREDLEKVAEKTDIGDVDTIIKNIRKIDEIYEPEHGVFKST